MFFPPCLTIKKDVSIGLGEHQSESATSKTSILCMKTDLVVISQAGVLSSVTDPHKSSHFNSFRA